MLIRINKGVPRLDGMESRGLGADSRGTRMAKNASTHHDMMICFVRTEKRWGRVEMHWFAIGLRLICDWFAIRLRLVLVAVWLR